MLVDEVKKSRTLRKFFLIPILIIGLIGLLIPIIPGLLFIYIFLVLVNPDIADLVKDKAKDLIVKLFRV